MCHAHVAHTPMVHVAIVHPAIVHTVILCIATVHNVMADIDTVHPAMDTLLLYALPEYTISLYLYTMSLYTLLQYNQPLYTVPLYTLLLCYGWKMCPSIIFLYTPEQNQGLKVEYPFGTKFLVSVAYPKHGPVVFPVPLTIFKVVTPIPATSAFNFFPKPASSWNFNGPPCFPLPSSNTNFSLMKGPIPKGHLSVGRKVLTWNVPLNSSST